MTSPITTISTGIAQSDILIRAAIVSALADMRAKPWLVDYVFAGLLQDGLTSSQFGQKQLRETRDWFLKTNVNIYHGLGITEPELPAITITLQESSESDKTLGDIHYDTSEDFPSDNSSVAMPVLAPPFTPTSYDPVGGIITLPADILASVYIYVGLQILDSSGVRHTITDILDDDRIVVDGNPTDYTNATLRYPEPAYGLMLESVHMKETYMLGVHVSGPPLYLLALHSVLVFALRRYKQSLLEARGFLESTLSSADFARSPAMQVEATYSRYVTLTGTVRHVWPKDVVTKIQTIQPQFQIIGGDHVPEEFGPTKDLAWIGDRDSIG